MLSSKMNKNHVKQVTTQVLLYIREHMQSIISLKYHKGTKIPNVPSGESPQHQGTGAELTQDLLIHIEMKPGHKKETHGDRHQEQ